MGASAVWLLDLEVGGVVWRFATEAITVSLNDGASVQYRSGLGSLALGSASPTGERSESVEVVSSVDWFAIVARGASLDRQEATVRLWRTGDVLETARVYLRGTTADARHGSAGEALIFSIRSSPSDRSAWFPLGQAVVEDETWPKQAGNRDIVERSKGKPYPLVIGVPGHHPKGGVTFVPEMGTPMLYAEYDPARVLDSFVVIADGRIHASTIRWHDAAQPTFSADRAIVEARDDLGRLVSGIEFVPATDDTQNQYWAGFGDDASYGGGKLNPYGPGMLRGAGDVIRWVLDECTTLDIDLPRIIGAASWLNRWKVDAVINKAVNMLEWLDSEVLAHIPVMRVDGPDGFHYSPLRWDATDEDVVARLLPGMVSRTSPVTTYDSEIRNSMTLQYRPVRDGGAFGSRRVLGPEYARHATAWGVLGVPSFPWYATTHDDARFFADPLCRWSHAQHGPAIWEGTNASTWDDASAALTLDYMALRYATPKRLARYTGPMDRLEGIEPGDVVTLTDPEIYASDLLCLVAERITSTTTVALDLIMLDDPLATSRRIV